MKKLAVLTILVTTISAFWWLARSRNTVSTSNSSPATKSAPGSGLKKPQAPEPIISPAQVTALMAENEEAKPIERIEAPPPTPVAIPVDYLQSFNTPHHQEAEEIALQLRHYGQRFGGNPTGTNAEIASALRGNNPKRANFIPQSARFNENDELIDFWGTPWFFHSNSATDTEVRSAGPDRKLYTSDDIVTK